MCPHRACTGSHCTFRAVTAKLQAVGRPSESACNSAVTTEYAIPTSSARPLGITAGPDGNLWFTEYNGLGHKIGRITTGGTITEYSLPTSDAYPVGITTGPDGNLWFTEQEGNNIGKITP
ncbi:MAG: Vgb family protein [Vulcanimicrobiaceae bacterium]